MCSIIAKNDDLMKNIEGFKGSLHALYSVYTTIHTSMQVPVVLTMICVDFTMIHVEFNMMHMELNMILTDFRLTSQ